MPQLNPAPWFPILILSWLVFLILVKPKVLSHTFPNEPAAQSSQAPKTEPWTWPWT
uniref:ATP synthase complex subunit 8 n=1 Tax=Glossogobius aureus TaxID=443695 RepID=A0A7U0R6T3_9GOBI|nr:ATP synthase F0 subunit 8 [Glossogobius aureus]QQX28250.1 ATP synthase F0 subunit 8 [Glossogobius aureus]